MVDEVVRTGRALEAARKRRGITREEMSAKTGLSVRVLAAIECGRSLVTGELQSRIEGVIAAAPVLSGVSRPSRIAALRVALRRELWRSEKPILPEVCLVVEVIVRAVQDVHSGGGSVGAANRCERADAVGFLSDGRLSWWISVAGGDVASCLRLLKAAGFIPVDGIQKRG